MSKPKRPIELVPQSTPAVESFGCVMEGTRLVAIVAPNRVEGARLHLLRSIADRHDFEAQMSLVSRWGCWAVWCSEVQAVRLGVHPKPPVSVWMRFA